MRERDGKGSPGQFVRPLVIGVAVMLLGVVGSGASTTWDAEPAAAYPSANVTLIGHGFGHGRGMGQWGAFGYALAGTSWQGIVTHYYSGSTPTLTTPSQEGTDVHVVLTENNGNDVTVTSGNGFTVQNHHVAANQAVWMHANGSGGWDLRSGTACGGPWAAPFATGVVNPLVIPDHNPDLGDPNSSTLALQLCQQGGNLTVRGYLEATYNTSTPPAARTVNIVPLEEYVAGVVPNESPSYWGTIGTAGPQGQAWGFQSLEAQAVAARSYVMAALGSYGGYADTCDQTCQTYRGIANESPLSDAATTNTLGYVMEEGGRIMTTEYSASTGGYTAPGTFPAVVDAGDAVCPAGVAGACNPNHSWTVSIPVSTVDSTWPQLGGLVSISITGRNGYGAAGGRVTAMTLVGTSQSLNLSGDQFAAAMNLRSTWFSVSNALSGPAVGMTRTPDSKGYWLAGADGSVAAFGDASSYGSLASTTLAAPVVAVASTPSGKGYWMVASDGGIFSFGDARFYGSMGAVHLNEPIVGMAPSPSGNGYWMVASDGGIFSFGDARFYGSTGAIHLNQPVVGMAATPSGHGYWMVASDGGIFSFGDAHFYGSMGAKPLNQPIVGMSSIPGGAGYRLVASDGGIFSFGAAGYFGSTGSITLSEPIVGMMGTTSGQGYWMVARDGGIFAFGDAGFLGSAAP